MNGAMKTVLKSARAVLDILIEIWKDPLARQIILWLLTKRLPSLASMSGSVARIPRSPYGAPRSMTILEGLALVESLGLRTPSCMARLSVAEMDGAWNGMGPRSWPEWLRNAVDCYARFLMILSLPHDMAFTFENDGTFAGWYATQVDWETNTEICLKNEAEKSNWWQRRRQAFVAGLVIQALRAGAFVAWKAAYCGNRKESVS